MAFFTVAAPGIVELEGFLASAQSEFARSSLQTALDDLRKVAVKLHAEPAESAADVTETELDLLELQKLLDETERPSIREYAPEIARIKAIYCCWVQVLTQLGQRPARGSI